MVLVVCRGHGSIGCDVGLGPAIAQSKPATKKPPQDKLGLVELEVKQLGHRQERQDFQIKDWTVFMEAEVNRLDADHSGE
jgi:hypothetical protein